MPDAVTPSVDPTAPVIVVPGDSRASIEKRRKETESRVAEISSLLNALEEAAAASTSAKPPAKTPSATPPAPAPAASGSAPLAAIGSGGGGAPALPVDSHENQLVQVRLGIASSLFAALQHKHPPTASHCLRVALGCSTWALYKRLDDETRDVVELAGLLHDVGKMSLPDNLLAKGRRLPAQDQLAANKHWEAGVHILGCCCSSTRVLDAVRYAGRRFSGGPDAAPAGDDLPLESRMIAIVDAFDQMTADPSETGYVTREQALDELARGAGTLYDPILVKQFVELISHDHEALTHQVAVRWLSDLGKRKAELPWQREAGVETPAPPPSQPVLDCRALFEQQLIDSMHDGVIFVDAQQNIFMWSKGAERLTGVSSSAAMGRQFLPSLLDMCNSAGRRVRDDACPVTRALTSVAQLRLRLEILGRQGEHVAIDLHAIPVFCADGHLRGATVLLQDAQPEASLEEKCEALHAEATTDPMTKVANRAEFDRMLALFIEAHQQAGLPCSLIMADIDHFKSINDTFGHQKGDDAIITVATLLKSMCRSGDLVARYGGEEFAVLCSDCNMVDAAARAEQIRRKLSETAHADLGNRKLTASFGVAQLQASDTPETLLRRSDQALLAAKDQGRNQVVQMGNTVAQQPAPKKAWWGFGIFHSEPLLKATLTMDVPINVAIEKMRGFVTDQGARIVSIRDNRVELEMSSENLGAYRRRGDRPSFFRIEFLFTEERFEKTNSFGLAAGTYAQTVAKVAVRPRRRRNRRGSDQLERARLVLQSIKSYLMAHDETEETAGA